MPLPELLADDISVSSTHRLLLRRDAFRGKISFLLKSLPDLFTGIF